MSNLRNQDDINRTSVLKRPLMGVGDEIAINHLLFAKYSKYQK